MADSGGTSVVLLVDDDEAVRGAVAHFLEFGGYAVLEAANGLEALELFGRAERVDLVITDMVMDVLSGEETIRRLRQVNPEIPVIGMSGAFLDNPGAASALGIQAVMAKPFKWSELLTTVESVLKAARSGN